MIAACHFPGRSSKLALEQRLVELTALKIAQLQQRHVADDLLDAATEPGARHWQSLDRTGDWAGDVANLGAWRAIRHGAPGRRVDLLGREQHDRPSRSASGGVHGKDDGSRALVVREIDDYVGVMLAEAEIEALELPRPGPPPSRPRPYDGWHPRRSELLSHPQRCRTP